MNSYPSRISAAGRPSCLLVGFYMGWPTVVVSLSCRCKEAPFECVTSATPRNCWIRYWYHHNSSRSLDNQLGHSGSISNSPIVPRIHSRSPHCYPNSCCDTPNAGGLYQ